MAKTAVTIRRLMLSILEAWSDGDRSILTLRKFYSIPNYVMLRTLPAGSLPTARISLDLSSCYSDAERAIKDAAGRNDIDAKSRDTAQALYCVARSTHALRDEMFPSSLGDGEDMQDLKFFLSFKGNPFHRLGILTNQFNSDPYKERYYSSDVLNNTAILRKEVLTSLYIALESLTAWPWDRSLVPGKVVATVVSAVGSYARVYHTHFCGDIPFITCSLRFKISKPGAAAKAMEYAFRHKMPTLSADEFEELKSRERRENPVTPSEEDASLNLEPID